LSKNESFWELIKKFWANNIRTNYKKISIALGTFLNIAIGWFFFEMCEIAPDFSPIWIGIIAVTTILVFSFFGTKKNGNGYRISPTKKIIKVLEQNPIIRDAVEREVKRMDEEDREQFFNNDLKHK